MKTAYFNCASGIAGDMILASAISSGLSADTIEQLLKDKLHLGGWDLEVKDVTKKHFPAKHVNVRGKIRFGSPAKMKNIISESGFNVGIKTRSLAVMDTLINSEAKVHKLPPEQVHFHEINSIDTLVDIVGASLVFDMMGISDIYSSALNIGKAAPATLEILKARSVPAYSTNSKIEMTTPTGAAIISTVAKAFGSMPEMIIEKSGAGAGTFELEDSANILVLLLGSQALKKTGLAAPKDEVMVLETNIDDMDPRIYPYVMEKLFALGAKDVWFTQVIMKKGRPGIVMSVICALEKETEIVNTIFNETTTLGIRSFSCSRHVLKRETGKDGKTAYLPGGRARVKSEYEKVKLKAQAQNTPLKKILL
jgi:uncharacterized protein (TIGR00299 family) protein